MANVSRPLIGLLVATVAFFALWVVALKPSSSPSGTGHALGAYQPAINAAKASVASQNAAAAAANATSASPSATSGASPTSPAPAAQPASVATRPVAAAKPAARTKPTATATSATRTAKPGAVVPNPTPVQRRNIVDRALAKHEVLALLVYNPAAADDQAVKRELGTIPRSGGRVVKLAIPVGEVTNYHVITSQLQITSSPTLVIVDSRAQAYSLVGFVDRFEIAQRLADALRGH